MYQLSGFAASFVWPHMIILPFWQSSRPESKWRDDSLPLYLSNR